VDIVRFVDEHQPGFVACEFTDSEGRRHTLVDKLPIFTAEDLRSNSSYPQPGVARCEVLAHLKDSKGRNVARITIAKPDLLEFIVLESQISDDW